MKRLSYSEALRLRIRGPGVTAPVTATTRGLSPSYSDEVETRGELQRVNGRELTSRWQVGLLPEYSAL